MSVTRVSPPGDGQNARLSKWEDAWPPPTAAPAPATLRPSVSPGFLC